MSTIPMKLGLRVKGPVNLRKDVYVPRPSDDEVFELLKAGEYCNVVSSRQMGKTSLLFRTKLRLAKEVGVKTCSIDVGGELGSPENADDWYQDLLGEIVDEIGLSLDVAAWWRASSSATPNRRLIQFFRDEVAAKAAAPVVIFLDEIDYTLKFAFTDDFFLAIRAMYNDRQREPAFERITFCLVGVVTPNELIKNQRTTPYNIGRTIELGDFDPKHDDLSALYSAVDDDPDTGKRLVEAVLVWTDGHPYLTMKHCAEVVRSGVKTPQEVDQLIDRSYSTFEAAKSDEHFETVLRMVRERVDDNDRLTALTLYRRIYRGRREIDRTTPAHIALKLSGLVKRDDRGMLVVRNRIYRRVFTDTWAKKTMPPVARAVRAARRGTVASIILLVLTAGIWYEGIYPRQLTNRLNAAIAEDRYARDVYQLLRGIPFYSSKADRLWASLFDRRAARSEGEKNRDAALLWRLKALSILPTDRRARDAALLIGDDYSQLVRSIHIPKGRYVALSRDGRVVAVDEGDVVHLLRTESGEPVGKHLDFRHVIMSMSLGGDGRVLAGGVIDLWKSPAYTVRLWRTESGEQIGKAYGMEPPSKFPSSKFPFELVLVALSGDGRTVAAGINSGGTVRVWRTESEEPIGKPIDWGDNGLVSALALSDDGRILAAVVSNGVKGESMRGIVRLWRIGSGELNGQPQVHYHQHFSGASRVVALSGDGRRAALEFCTGKVRVWNTESGKTIGEPLDCGSGDSSLALSGDGRVLAVGDARGTVRLWIVDTGRPVENALNLGESCLVGELGFDRISVSNDGRVVAVGDNVVRIWHVALDEPIDRPASDPIQGDQKDRLPTWEKRLGLRINDENGQIEPLPAGKAGP